MPASPGRRLTGYAVDCLVLFAGLLALQALLYPVNPIVARLRESAAVSGGQLHLWVFATATVPFLLYFALMVSSSRHATLGMRVLALRVEAENGSPVGFPRALVRSAVLLVPFEINHTLMFHFTPADGAAPSVAVWIGIGVVWVLIGLFLVSVLVSRQRQSVHDLVAGTVVLRAAGR